MKIKDKRLDPIEKQAQGYRGYHSGCRTDYNEVRKYVLKVLDPETIRRADQSSEMSLDREHGWFRGPDDFTLYLDHVACVWEVRRKGWLEWLKKEHPDVYQEWKQDYIEEVGPMIEKLREFRKKYPGT